MKRLSVKGYVQIVDDQSDDVKTRDVYMDKGGFLMDSRYPITTIVDLVGTVMACFTIYCVAYLTTHYVRLIANRQIVWSEKSNPNALIADVDRGNWGVAYGNARSL